MDEITASTARPTGTSTVVPAASDQPSLPLAFDDGADEPIGYALTARARREVAPHAVPELRVVPPGQPDTDLDRPGDTRPSRARALRRGGSGVAEIARILEVDELVVRAWVGDVGTRSRRSPAGRPRPSDQRVAASEAAQEPDPDGDGSHVAFELARAAAREEAATRLDDPAFAAGLGLVSAIVTVDGHAATLVSSRLTVAATAVGWLRRTLGGDAAAQVRVVLRLGPDVAGDLACHRWASAMQLPTDRVLHTRWRGAPSGDAVEALIRLPDPSCAAMLAGWCDALLDPAAATAATDAGF